MVVEDFLRVVGVLAFLFYSYTKLRECFRERETLQGLLEQEKILNLSLETQKKKLEEELRVAKNTITNLKISKGREEYKERIDERNRILKYGTIEELKAWRRAQ